jgi:type IV pilus assembly protein PilF
MMRTLLIAALLALCASCSSDGTKANLAEAARINAQLGSDYLRQGQVDLAREKLERALEEDDRYAPAHSTMALVLQRQGDMAGAEKHFRRALSLESDNPEMRNNFGVFLCAEGKALEAERYFTDAINDKRYQTPEVAWVNAGLCAKTYDPAKAERDFRQALQINPNFSQALVQLAAVAFGQQDYLHARAFLERFEAVGQPAPDTLVLGARIERALGDEVAARKYEMRLRHDFPDSPEAAAAATPAANP